MTFQRENREIGRKLLFHETKERKGNISVGLTGSRNSSSNFSLEASPELEVGIGLSFK